MKRRHILAAIGAIAALFLCHQVSAQTIGTVISPNPIQHFVDNNGNAISGGKLFTYLAGTTTKTATYNSASGVTANTNPVILNTRGEAQVWLNAAVVYKFVLAPSTDTDPPTNPIWTVDKINAATVQTVGGVNVVNFGADPTGAADSATGFNNALATCQDVYVPPGTYKLASQVVLCNGGGMKLYGAAGASVLKPTGGGAAFQNSCADAAGSKWFAVIVNFNCGGSVINDKNVTIRDITIDGSAIATSGCAGNCQFVTILVLFRNVQNGLIDDLRCINSGFADCTALLHGINNTVTNSYSSQAFNANFDSWDSPTSTSLINSYADCGGIGTYGALFNATDTGSDNTGTATNYNAVGNKFINCIVPIFVDPLTTASLVSGVNIANTYIENGCTGGACIAITGNVVGANVAQTVIAHVNAPNSNLLEAQQGAIGSDTGTPVSVKFTDPSFFADTALNLIKIGTGSLGDSVTGFRAATVTANYDVLVQTGDAYIQGDFPTLTLGNVSFPAPGTGTGVTFVNTFPAPSTLGTCPNSALAQDSPMTGAVVVGAGGTGTTSCTVNFPTNYWSYTPRCFIDGGSAPIFGLPSPTVLTLAIGAGNIPQTNIYWDCK